ncbi:MAG: NAD(P)-dependent oxidoreductase, partial [Aminobacteriaceae bacterium]
SEGYPLEKAYKDIVSAFKVSGEMKLPLPVFNAAAAVFQAALLKGYGSENKGAMIKVYEELYGVEFRTGKTQKKE